MRSGVAPLGLCGVDTVQSTHVMSTCQCFGSVPAQHSGELVDSTTSGTRLVLLVLHLRCVCCALRCAGACQIATAPCVVTKWRLSILSVYHI